jgi:LAGLIDADG-like domain
VDDRAYPAAQIETEVAVHSPGSLRAYLDGAMRDGTCNARHGTCRISQASLPWLRVLQRQITLLGRRSWIYREGSRDVWVLETSMNLTGTGVYGTRGERLAFARGYFDAEGGVPRSPTARFYVQFVQKDLPDLAGLRALLEEEGILCGRVHNPSWRVDPAYWRFYVRSVSHREFATAVGSWHPRKRVILDERFRTGPAPRG